MLRFEYKKLIRERLLVAVILSLALINIGYLALDLITTRIGKSYTYKEYKELSSALSSGSVTPEALQESLDTLSVNNLQYAETIAGEYHLLQAVLREWEEVEGYSDYLEETSIACDRIMASRLMQTTRSSIANAEKTKKDFAAMGEVKPLHAATEGISLLLKDRLGDYLFLLLLLLLVAELICSEGEAHRFPLLRTMNKGRGRLLLAKYTMGFLLISLFFGTTSLVRLALVSMTYGIPNVPVQSIVDYKDCILLMDSRQLLFLYYVGKWLSLFALYSLFFTLGWLIQKPQLFYPAGLAVTGISEYLYRVVDPNSHLALLKWLNPMAILDNEEAFHYRNLSCFGSLISYSTAAGGMLLIFILLGLPLSILVSNVIWDKRRLSGSAKLPWLTGARGRSRGITFFERKKWLWDGRGYLIILGLVALLLLMYDTPSKRLYTEEEITYYQYMEQVKGSYAQEKLDKLKTDYEIVEQPGKRAGLEKIISYGEYLKAVKASDFVYEKGYEALFGREDSYFLFLCYRLAAMLAMTTCGIMIWYTDISTGMDRLIMVSAIGRTLTRRQKILQTLQAALGILFITYVIWTARAFAAYPDLKLVISANSLRMFRSWGQLPLWGLGILAIMLQYMLLVGYGLLSAFLVEKTRNVILTATIATLAGAVPVLLL